MFKKGLSTVLFILTLALCAANVAVANGTPDGQTPANEGICDDLFFATPGLFGLCVAFCEAQDCEATLDPATGEVEFGANCKTSNAKILANYNRRKSPSDPPMPCVNQAASECPCWTEGELNEVADGVTLACAQIASDFTQMLGFDAQTNGLDRVAVNAGSQPGDGDCFYQEQSPSLIIRGLDISDEQVELCRQSVLAECEDRGF